MRKRKLVLTVIIALPVMLALTAFLMHDPEPYYQGRSLSAWYELWTHTAGDDYQTNEAATAIRHIGTNALPFVLKRLRYHPSRLRTTFSEFAEKLPAALAESRILKKLLSESGPPDQSGVFDILGPLASPAVPELTELLHSTTDPQAARNAAYCLAAIGNAGMRPLLDALARPQPPCCYYVAELFAYAGASGPPVLQTNLAQAAAVLAKCAAGKDLLLATTATEALGDTSMDPKIVIPALTNSLHSPHPQLRSAAVRSLAYFQADGYPMLPHLLAALTDPSETVRATATNRLQIAAPEVFTNAPPE